MSILGRQVQTDSNTGTIYIHHKLDSELTDTQNQEKNI